MVKTSLRDHFQRPTLPTSIDKVEIVGDRIIVNLSDGRQIHTPLSWFPLLHSAQPDQCKKFRISPRGIHWDALDEDIPIETFLDDYR